MQKVISIHNLRGMACLAVVLFHFRFYLDGAYEGWGNIGTSIFGNAAFGVDLFFMISGFIISLATEKNGSKISFIIRRFFRIYPLFLLTFAVGALTTYSNNSTSDLLRAAFLLHKDYTQSSPSFGFHILGPAWTLSYEIYFYTLFLLSMAISHRYRLYICSALLLVPIVYFQLEYTDSFTIKASGSVFIDKDNDFYSIVRFITSPMLLEFIIGIFFYRAYTAKIKIDKGLCNYLLFICVSMFLLFYYSTSKPEFGISCFGYWSAVLMIGFLTYDKFKGFKDRAIIRHLGDISFSLYISHYLVINTLDKIMPDWWNFSGIAKIILALFICISIATLLHTYVEVPFITAGKKFEHFFSKRKGAINNISQQ